MQSTPRQEVFAKLNGDGYPDISANVLMVGLLKRGYHLGELSEMSSHLGHLGVGVDKVAVKDRRRRQLAHQTPTIDFNDLMYPTPHEALQDFSRQHKPE